MEEINESLFIFSIYEKKENEEALLNAFNIDGEKLILRAKGYQKEQSKNRLIFEPMSFIKTEYFDTLGKTKLLKRGEKILFTNKQSKQIIFIKEIIYELFKNEEKINSNIIKLIYYLFNKYNNGFEIENYLFALLVLFLKDKGIYFELNKCKNCGNKYDLDYLLLHKGGVFCNKCYFNEESKIDYEFLLKVKMLFNIKSIKNINELNFNPKEEMILKEILKNYYENELGYFLKNLRNI
ncbi:MAG: hypothetical protein HPAVJP_2180 [Candidatus Hepatoplasma vulgare]|nr:MAG: hypothetical protein HPAVJP_2180 [Candidatus Hepatoplasma sp.]